MKIFIDKKAIIHYVLLYLVLLLQGAYLMREYEDIVYISIFLLTGCMFAAKYYYVTKKQISVVIAILVLMIISSILNSGSLSILSMGNVLARLLLGIVVVQYDKKNVAKRFINIVTFFSTISIIGYVLQIKYPVLLTSFMHQENGYYFNVLFSWSYNIHKTKNIGIFNEPGLYSIVLLVALYFLLFTEVKNDYSKKAYKIRLISIVVALITAQSTAGYVTLMLFVFLFVYRSKGTITPQKILIIAVMLIAVIIDLAQGENGFISRNIFAKIFNDAGKLDLTVSTGKARIVSALADLEVAIRYPLGAGFEIYNEIWSSYLREFITDKASCAGITKSLATYGFPITIVYFGYLFGAIFKAKQDKLECLVCVGFIIIWGLTQPIIFFPLYMLFSCISTRKL